MNAKLDPWQIAAMNAEPTKDADSLTGNCQPEIDSDVASLAKAAQQRWFRENPY